MKCPRCEKNDVEWTRVYEDEEAGTTLYIFTCLDCGFDWEDYINESV
jgi:DNA-directed RNA polymerase subunit M/transcription elongation factor TFIIS